jgi:hypothetical protein
MNMVDRLNDLTKAEIDTLRIEIASRKKKLVEQPCLFCGTVVSMRPDQKYCSGSCRAKAHKEHTVLLYHKLLHERQVWTEERKNYIKEIANLRAKILALGGTP